MYFMKLEKNDILRERVVLANPVVTPVFLNLYSLVEIFVPIGL